MSSIIKTTRKEIFDGIWNAKNISLFADARDISLNELLKVCEEKNIPLPYDSYYGDKYFGKLLRIPELPPAEEETVELHCVWKRRKASDAPLGSKANALCILQTLEDYSDANKWLSISDIIRLLESNYRLRVDRRTIYTSIELLIDLGYQIGVTKEENKNYYSMIEKTLEPYEVKIIMDSLMLNPLLPHKMRDEICNKINKYLAKRMSAQRDWVWHTFDMRIEKYDIGDELYRILDEIDAALAQGKKLSFGYTKYDTNGNKVVYRDEKYLVHPKQIQIRNFTYYLLCRADDEAEFKTFRLDRMTNVCMLDAKADGVGAAGRTPIVGSYNYGQNEGTVTFKCDNELLEKVTDDFANHLNSVSFSDNNDGTFNFSVWMNYKRAMCWAASVLDKCAVTEPQEVWNMVIEKIKNNKYGI